MNKAKLESTKEKETPYTRQSQKELIKQRFKKRVSEILKQTWDIEEEKEEDKP